jgi:hypothetical protein
MIEIIIGEILITGTSIVLGSLYYANKIIHKREVDSNTPKPRHVILKVPAKPVQPELKQKGLIIATLKSELEFCKTRLLSGNLSSDAGIHYRARITEITNQIVKIHS